MKILLIGECYSSNLGDGVIFDCVKYLIKNKYPNAEINALDLSMRLDYNNLYLKKTYNFKEKIFNFCYCRFGKILFKNRLYRTIYKKDIYKYYFEYELKPDYDLAIFYGGSLFMDYFAAQIYLVISILNKKHTPVLFNACGIGRIDDDTQYTIKKALRFKNVKAISLRDGFDKFTELYNYRNIQNTYDCALWALDVYKITKKESKIIGVGVINKKEFMSLYIDIINELKKCKYSWKIFTNGDKNDYRFAYKLLEQAEINDFTYIEKRSKNPEELVNIISHYSFIISARLHSHIIATSLGIPSVAIVWDDKIVEYFKKINCYEQCFTQESSAADIVDIINNNQRINTDEINRQKEYAENVLLNMIDRTIKDDT